MDGIQDIHEPGYEFDFDNDLGMLDDPSNPVVPNTGGDGFDHDSDNDGIEDWSWGNDTVLIQPITGAVKSILYFDNFTSYIDDINNTIHLNYDIYPHIQLDISDLSEGEHTIYLQHSGDDGQNINPTTYEFHFEVQKESPEEVYYGPPLFFFMILFAIMIFLMVLIIVVYIMIKKPRMM